VYIGQHSAIINGATLSDDDSPADAELACGDCRASDYLHVLLDITESLIQSYLQDLGCQLTDMNDGDLNEGFQQTINTILESHQVSTGKYWEDYDSLLEAELHDATDEEAEKKLERHCLMVAWLEAVYFCGNYRFNSFDGNCFSRYVQWGESEPNFGNFVGMARPNSYPWDCSDMEDFKPGHGGRISLLDEPIFQYMHIDFDENTEISWLNKMHPINAIKIMQEL